MNAPATDKPATPPAEQLSPAAFKMPTQAEVEKAVLGHRVSPLEHFLFVHTPAERVARRTFRAEFQAAVENALERVRLQEIMDGPALAS